MRTLKRLLRRSALLRVCKTITRRKQSTVAERISSFNKEEPTPFRCPGPHSPSRVEGVAGTIAIGRRLRHSKIKPEECPAVKSLVSSVTQADILCLRGVCLHPICTPALADSAIRILAEPSNNSNSLRFRQQILRPQAPNRGRSHKNRSGQLPVLKSDHKLISRALSRNDRFLCK